MKGVQCYELFGGIALKNHTFSFSFCSKCLRNTFGNILIKSPISLTRLAFRWNPREDANFAVPENLLSGHLS